MSKQKHQKNLDYTIEALVKEYQTLKRCVPTWKENLEKAEKDKNKCLHLITVSRCLNDKEMEENFNNLYFWLDFKSVMMFD